MFESTVFCGRMCLGHTEPPGGVLAKIFYQIDSVCSTFLCVRFHFTMRHRKIFENLERKKLTSGKINLLEEEIVARYCAS